MPKPRGSDARARALRLLARAEQCRAKLRGKLLASGKEEAEADADEIELLLDWLEAEGFLSDLRYATLRLKSRGPRMGDDKIRFELLKDGVDEAIIDEAFAALAEEEVPDEAARCIAVRAKKFGDLPDSLEEKARQSRFLSQRGFSFASIRQALSKERADG
ncbi:MAG: RecX family transcriptional regulator [Zoogloeaceae bacterium]|jgi:regulatory protein|nr:RecX family transcriptional regulator [Zoogloeaceae bacterium]